MRASPFDVDRRRASVMLFRTFASLVVALSSANANANANANPSRADAAPEGEVSQDAKAAQGRAIFRQCLSCHALDPEQLRHGPHLFGVVGRPIASVEGYSYSDGLMAKDGVWTDRNLRLFLTAPNEFAPGTKKQFKLRRDADFEPLIAYLVAAAS